MSAEKIEALLKDAGAGFLKISERAWELKPGAKRNLSAKLVWITGSFRKEGDLLKIHTRVGKLPENAGIDFFQDLLRKNRDLGHGAFALCDEETICFVDTLELENCNPNEMEATLDWLDRAIDVFKEKLDRAKLPYIEA
jgi:hypothetical protein